MTANEFKTASVLAGAASALSSTQAAQGVEDLISRIKSADDKVRGPAWQGAGPAGAPAVQPLGALLTDPNFEVARSAKRALYQIIRHASRPGAATEASAVERELLALLENKAAFVRREAVWMLSEIAGEAAIGPIAALLTDKDAREDARCALLRFPGAGATAALQAAFATAPEDFKPALAESLRQRGQKVEGYPSQRRVPTKPTTVGQAKTSG